MVSHEYQLGVWGALTKLGMAMPKGMPRTPSGKPSDLSNAVDRSLDAFTDGVRRKQIRVGNHPSQLGTSTGSPNASLRVNLDDATRASTGPRPSPFDAR